MPPNVLHDGNDSIYGKNQQEIIELHAPAIERGNYRIRTITDKDLKPEYAGFKIEMVGLMMTKEPPVPRGAFLSRGREGRNNKPLYIYYNAARITHQDSALIIEHHWAPEHERVVRMKGFERVATTPAELEIINTALKFYQGETRGAPKLDDNMLSKAVKKFGDKATQVLVAAELNVDTSTLRRWMYKRGIESWGDAKEIYQFYRGMDI